MNLHGPPIDLAQAMADYARLKMILDHFLPDRRPSLSLRAIAEQAGLSSGHSSAAGSTVVWFDPRGFCANNHGKAMLNSCLGVGPLVGETDPAGGWARTTCLRPPQRSILRCSGLARSRLPMDFTPPPLAKHCWFRRPWPNRSWLCRSRRSPCRLAGHAPTVARWPICRRSVGNRRIGQAGV
jgi:hypothetical protein